MADLVRGGICTFADIPTMMSFVGNNSKAFNKVFVNPLYNCKDHSDFNIVDTIFDTYNEYYRRTLACPKSGSFTAWKKILGFDGFNVVPALAELRIPDKAKRSSSFGTKCRCSEAEVVSITAIRNGAKLDIGKSFFLFPILYKVGETVKVDNFEENRWAECAPGIHFFMKREEAIAYHL